MTSTLTRNASLGVAALGLTLVSSIGEAAQWTYQLGVHNMVVRDVDSTTWGLSGCAESTMSPRRADIDSRSSTCTWITTRTTSIPTTFRFGGTRI